MYMMSRSLPANWQAGISEILASSSPSNKVMFVGVGHRMRGDDYVGSFIAKTLIKRVRADRVAVFDAEDNIESVISKIAKFNPPHVILIDACELNARPGEINLVPLAETDYPFFTTHGIPLKLLASKLLPNAEAWVLGVQPERMELSESLSPAVFASASSISDFIVNSLMEGI